MCKDTTFVCNTQIVLSFFMLFFVIGDSLKLWELLLLFWASCAKLNIVPFI